MIINFLGDSITEGVGASSLDKNYVSLVQKKTNLTVNNYGLSGSRIAKQKSISDPITFDYDFQMRALNMDKSDFLFVFGGTNDWGHGDALIGDINSNDPYTFCGGLNNLLKIILTKYNKGQICFILPMHRVGEDNPYGEQKESKTLSLKGYVDIMKTILNKNKIEYIDLYENGPKVDSLIKGGTFLFDHVHPNDIGHEYLSNVVIDYLKSKNII